MRSLRSAKFAEYVSTYALLNLIGIHDTVLIEKRDASVGHGVYVRDACDAGTTLLVIPAHRICSTAVLSHIGTKVRLRSAAWPTSKIAALDSGMLSHLTNSPAAHGWMEWAWRVALEHHRSYSHWWGWLQSVPSTPECGAQVEAALAKCRTIHPSLTPYYQKARKRIAEETSTAYAILAVDNMMPTPEKFSWAVESLLSRGMRVPCAWGRPPSSTVAAELAVVPYVDLINGADEAGRAPNATVEVALGLEELPDWYTAWIVESHCSRSSQGDDTKARSAALDRVLEQPFAMCVTLNRALQPAEEVILGYDIPMISTGVLSTSEDEVLSRLVKYGY